MAHSTLLRVAAAELQLGDRALLYLGGICAQMRMRRGSVETRDLPKSIPQNFDQISLR